MTSLWRTQGSDMQTLGRRNPSPCPVEMTLWG